MSTQKPILQPGRVPGQVNMEEFFRRLLERMRTVESDNETNTIQIAAVSSFVSAFKWGNQ